MTLCATPLKTKSAVLNKLYNSTMENINVDTTLNSGSMKLLTIICLQNVLSMMIKSINVLQTRFNDFSTGKITRFTKRRTCPVSLKFTYFNCYKFT